MTQPVAIYYEVKGLGELIRALKQVADYPSYRVTSSLEGVLKQGFEATQVRTAIGTGHGISGRLNASGYSESDFDGNVWTGFISYGGPEGTPAYYAIFEAARSGVRSIPPHTTHDFFHDLPGHGGGAALDKAFEDAIDQHFQALS